MRPTMSLFSQTVIAVVLVSMSVGVWYARGPVIEAIGPVFGKTAKPEGRDKRKRGRGDRAVPVVVAAVGEARDDVSFAAIGTARARRHVTIYPAVAGEVVTVHTRAGDKVISNAPLVELEARKARLAVEMVRSKLEGANRLLERADRLRERRVQSSARVDDAKTAAEQAEVELKAAEAALADHVIRAPFPGIVGIATVEVGDRVTPTSALVTLDDRSELTVGFEVPEQYLSRLARDMEVVVRTPGFGGRTFAGKLSHIDSRVHPTRRTIEVRATVANADDILRPGMSFAVSLKLPGKAYPEIPDLALQFGKGGNFVWRANADKAERVPVQIVRRDANSVLVAGAIKPGDRIIIEGVQRLRPGRQVRFVEPDEQKPGANAARAVN